MKVAWCKNLKLQSDKDNFQKYFNASTPVRHRLAEIIDERIEERRKVTPSDYDSPSWSHRQAHDNGYTEAMREILNLIRDSND